MNVEELIGDLEETQESEQKTARIYRGLKARTAEYRRMDNEKAEEFYRAAAATGRIIEHLRAMASASTPQES